MPQVTIAIDQEGQSEVSVQGVAGHSCLELTSQIVAALGETVSIDHTPEYHARVQQGARQAERATNRSR
jgi:hypothetical protein